MIFSQISYKKKTGKKMEKWTFRSFKHIKTQSIFIT